MLAAIVAAVLLTGLQDSRPSDDDIFEWARQREFSGRAPELVLMMSDQGGGRWQTIVAYTVLADSRDVPGQQRRHWIIRRDRWGDDWEYGEADDVPPDQVVTTWASSSSCPGVVTLLEGVERIPPVPYDLRGIGSDYYEDEILVGMAKSRFWLNAGPTTPAVETRWHRDSMLWWDSERVAACWTVEPPEGDDAPAAR